MAFLRTLEGIRVPILNEFMLAITYLGDEIAFLIVALVLFWCIDKRRGFIIGTDDYMTKPVDEEEMVLRVGALLRRSKIANERKLTVGSTTLYYDSLTVHTNEGDMELPQKEFLLLFKLLSYPGKIFTRRQLMDEIWDMESESDERTVDVHISRLRDRYRQNTDFEISTVRGLGYKAVHLK